METGAGKPLLVKVIIVILCESTCFLVNYYTTLVVFFCSVARIMQFM